MIGNATRRFCGTVGYIVTEEDAFGVTRPVETERTYFGNVENLATRWQQTEQLNDDLTVEHRISILADPYARQYFPYIRYVNWMGTRWTVKSVKNEYPRLILTLGGVYNGSQT